MTTLDASMQGSAPDLDDAQPAQAYSVALESYFGPLDLLIYLIRRDEMEITQIAIGQVVDQYLAYIEAMRALDINLAGEFLVMASTLMEIKARELLPAEAAPEEEEPLPEDPRADLVSRLLDYARFKTIGRSLQGLWDARDRLHTRPLLSVPGGEEGEERAPESLELWDLAGAYLRIAEATSLPPIHHLSADSPPLEEIMKWVLASLEKRAPLRFRELFGVPSPDRISIVGTFLALLELVKDRQIRVTQSELFGDIYIHPHPVSGLEA